ncbi:MAG TPA: transposase [Acidimicrobiales bacterium]|nr:transposase [Acidimicrobiales bacterium]
MNVHVIGGVDTHAATHCAAAIDTTGRLLGVAEFPASDAGYRRLGRWLRSQGELDAVGIEGTGAYGAGLARHLRHEQVSVVEVPRPERRLRRSHGKSDPVDAEAAARAVLAGTATVVPKRADGPVEAVRALRVARLGANKPKTAATNTLRSMIISAPEPLRSRLPSSGLPNKIIDACVRLRPDGDFLEDPSQGTKAALRSIAHRAQARAG